MTSATARLPSSRCSTVPPRFTSRISIHDPVHTDRVDDRARTPSWRYDPFQSTNNTSLANHLTWHLRQDAIVAVDLRSRTPLENSEGAVQPSPLISSHLDLTSRGFSLFVYISRNTHAFGRVHRTTGVKPPKRVQRDSNDFENPRDYFNKAQRESEPESQDEEEDGDAGVDDGDSDELSLAGSPTKSARSSAKKVTARRAPRQDNYLAGEGRGRSVFPSLSRLLDSH